MAFKLRSGNQARFKSLGSSSRPITPSRTKSSPFISKKQDKKNEKEWNKQTSDGSIIDPTGGSGADWLRQDLQSEGYKKRLANEIAMNEDNTEYLRAPNEKELKKDKERSIQILIGDEDRDYQGSDTFVLMHTLDDEQCLEIFVDKNSIYEI